MSGIHNTLWCHQTKPSLLPPVKDAIVSRGESLYITHIPRMLSLNMHTRSYTHIHTYKSRQLLQDIGKIRKYKKQQTPCIFNYHIKNIKNKTLNYEDKIKQMGTNVYTNNICAGFYKDTYRKDLSFTFILLPLPV